MGRGLRGKECLSGRANFSAGAETAQRFARGAAVAGADLFFVEEFC